MIDVRSIRNITCMTTVSFLQVDQFAAVIPDYRLDLQPNVLCKAEDDRKHLKKKEFYIYERN